MLYWQMLSPHSIVPGTDKSMLKDYLVANPTTLLMKEETRIALKPTLCKAVNWL